MTLTAPESADTAATRTIPRFVSVDDHIIEPPHVWQDRLPEKYKAVGPRVERLRVANLKFNGMQYSFDIVDNDADEGKFADFWCYEDLKVPMRRIIAAVGFPPEERTLLPVTYEEMRKGCWDQAARLEDMDVNHTEASLCFPTFPRFCGQTFLEAKDRELALLCVQAYNDWMVEEWCAGAGAGRLIPLIIVPLWDAQLAADEVYRNAARGVRAVCFSEIPPFLDLPSIHTGEWEPFFQACADTDTVINMHIGSSSRMPATSPDAPAGVQATLSFNNAMGSLADWLYSGILVRHPTLKLAYSEGQMGWIPYAMERADSVWREFRGWAFDKEAVPEPPSFYFRRQVYACFFRDNFGLKNLHDVGVDNVTFETDYPHSDSTWPDTKDVFTTMVKDLPDEDVYKIARGNAISMLGLDLD
ncbi:MAG: amidohydrolase [Acidimicrobiales bacterium]|jgi:predicted TIM-barrel fold metal-dependent hydrolase|nr:amidohydrolase [Acidimicrobiales bacterium]